MGLAWASNAFQMEKQRSAIKDSQVVADKSLSFWDLSPDRPVIFGQWSLSGTGNKLTPPSRCWKPTGWETFGNPEATDSKL